MALIRCNEVAAKPRILWIANHVNANSGFYDSNGNLVQTTGGTFTNNRGLTMTYGSSDNWSNVTNNGSEDLLILNGSSATPTVLGAGQSLNGVNFPIILMPEGTV